MNVFPQNILSSFKNYFNEEINLEGDWRVALSEIVFPEKINQVNESDLKIFSHEGLKFYEKSIPLDAVSRSYEGERAIIRTGSYENRDHILRSLKTATGLPRFDYQFNEINRVLFLFFGKNEGITFPDNEVPSILGFNGTHNGSGFHIGYKMLDTFEILTMAEDEEKTFVGDCLFDLSAGKQLIFIYVNISEYHYVGDTKAPLIRVIDSKQRLKNVSHCEIEPTHRIVFSNLEYKNLLSKNFQSIEIQLPAATGQFSSIRWNRKSYFDFKFLKNRLNRSILSKAIGVTILFRTLSPTMKWFWGFSCRYWQSRITDCKKISLACSQKDST